MIHVYATRGESAMGTRLSRYILHKLSLTELSSDIQTFKVLKAPRIIFRAGDSSCHWLDVCHMNLSPQNW